MATWSWILASFGDPDSSVISFLWVWAAPFGLWAAWSWVLAAQFDLWAAWSWVLASSGDLDSFLCVWAASFRLWAAWRSIRHLARSNAVDSTVMSLLSTIDLCRWLLEGLFCLLWLSLLISPCPSSCLIWTVLSSLLTLALSWSISCLSWRIVRSMPSAKAAARPGKAVRRGSRKGL